MFVLSPKWDLKNSIGENRRKLLDTIMKAYKSYIDEWFFGVVDKRTKKKLRGGVADELNTVISQLSQLLINNKYDSYVQVVLLIWL